MPRRNDIQSVLVLGAGPIVIGQACEFDYSGVQACLALRAEGYRVILVNSNPATIMTDPDMADAIYIEPVHPHMVAQIIAAEKPDAILPTMGGQTALNCALELAHTGVLAQYGVQLIGASQQAIEKAENRELFRQAMHNIGLEVPRSAIVHSLEEALEQQSAFGYPTIVRPSFTLGGSGGGIAYNREEFVEICQNGLRLSPNKELLIEESLIGWKEYELEVIRDAQDNAMVVCSIENLDPMGVHTGDSITVAPVQTLTDPEYQRMRDAAIAILREIGVETGGSNVQFGVCPASGRMVVIEMNPRVSRSSALASKATGFPIAKVAAKLAVGFSLDELRNEITGGLVPAAFEPALDYVVTKIPRFNFEKFPETEAVLSTQMKSVGEVMAIGRTFQESLQKALRGLEIGLSGLDSPMEMEHENSAEFLLRKLSVPAPKRILWVAEALRRGMSVETVYESCKIDPWFLHQIAELIQVEQGILHDVQITSETAPETASWSDWSQSLWRSYKQKGFSDARLAELCGTNESLIRKARIDKGVVPVFHRVDSCAAEFPADTAYLYSSYAAEPDYIAQDSPKIVILGGGPNRIGQGIEFDYCCVHAAMAVREQGYKAVMINCNPETVSTDFGVSDILFFEPLTLEDVLGIVSHEKPIGVIVQYGGQTPLKLTRALDEAGVPVLGTPADAIDCAEDRERFQALIQRCGLLQPSNGTVYSLEAALQVAQSIGYPIIARPSYVLGGRAMEVLYTDAEVSRYWLALLAQDPGVAQSGLLLDKFLDDAIEIDVDAVSDGHTVVIGGIMEHIEQAGVHSGDSACCLPAHSLGLDIQKQIAQQVDQVARTLGVVGLVNFQFAWQDRRLYILEVNPRASRTVPFVSKAIGVSLAKVGVKAMLGCTLSMQRFTEMRIPPYFSVKVPVFPFQKFPGVDPILGPEMRSTGEVMGVGDYFGEAYAKALWAAMQPPISGRRVLFSVKDADKSRLIPLARAFHDLGFALYATKGTAEAIVAAQLPCQVVNKIHEGRPHLVDLIKSRDLDCVVNTTEGKQAILDSYEIRRGALQHGVHYTTTLAAAWAISLSLQYENRDRINALSSLHERMLP